MAEKICINDPNSLYMLCLQNYVVNINQNVIEIEKLNVLKDLPPSVLSDIYLKVSQPILFFFTINTLSF